MDNSNKTNVSSNSRTRKTIAIFSVINNPIEEKEKMGTVFEFNRCVACLESLGKYTQAFTLTVMGMTYFFDCPNCVEFAIDNLLPRLDPFNLPNHQTLENELVEYYTNNPHPDITPRLTNSLILSKNPMNPLTPANAKTSDTKHNPSSTNGTLQESLTKTVNKKETKPNLESVLNSNPPTNPVLETRITNIPNPKHQPQETDSQRVTRKYEVFRKSYLDLMEEDLSETRSFHNLESAFNVFDKEFQIENSLIQKPNYINELNELRVLLWQKKHYPQTQIKDSICEFYHEFIQELLSSYADKAEKADYHERKVWNEFQMLLQKGWFEFDSELNSILWELYELVRKNYSNYFESES